MADIENVFSQSARFIADVAVNPPSVVTGMGRWFDYCESVAPKQAAIWKRLRGLDFEEDEAALSRWLQELMTNEPPPDHVNGLWFGLFNPILEDGEPSCQMYLGGSAGFDAESKSDEWVCQLSWKPAGRYSSSRVLTELYRSLVSVEEDDVNFLGEAFLCHGYLALVVSSWCHGPMRAALLGAAPVRAIVIGHDSGDFYRMAVLCAGTKAT